jgi:hypothetical protein
MLFLIFHSNEKKTVCHFELAYRQAGVREKSFSQAMLSDFPVILPSK